MALTALENRIQAFPKGALNVRKKAQQGRHYTYHYLVHREAARVMNRHVPGVELPALRKQLAGRDSGLDLLVEVGEEHSLLDIVGIRLDLEERIARRVELVEYDAIKPAIHERVLSERVRIL